MTQIFAWGLWVPQIYVIHYTVEMLKTNPISWKQIQEIGQTAEFLNYMYTFARDYVVLHKQNLWSRFRGR